VITDGRSKFEGSHWSLGEVFASSAAVWGGMSDGWCICKRICKNNSWSHLLHIYNMATENPNTA
jgi:hypothetical protein